MLSLAVTAFNEVANREGGRHLVRLLQYAETCDLIDDVVVRDDCSDDYADLEKLLRPFSKLRLLRNECNYGSLANKARAVRDCKNPRVVLMDSNNFAGDDYFAYASQWVDEDTIYCAEYGGPRLDWRKHWSDRTLTLDTLWQDRARPGFGSLINDGNYVVPRDAFVATFEGWLDDPQWPLRLPDYFQWPDRARDASYRSAVMAMDVILMNLFWLRRGGRLTVVRGMRYEHDQSNPKSLYSRAHQAKFALGPLYVCEALDAWRGVAATYRVVEMGVRRVILERTDHQGTTKVLTFPLCQYVAREEYKYPGRLVC